MTALSALNESHLESLGMIRLGDRLRFMHQRDLRLEDSSVETRQVTSVCWDIEGSTNLERKVGREQWRLFLGDFRAYCNQCFGAMRGLWAHHMVANELDAARNMALEMCQVAENQANAGLLREAHRALGQAFMFRDEFVAAMAEIDRVIGMYNPAGHIEYSVRYGN